MDWDKLRIFHAVAEAGSFTHAGETLNLSQSAVSRQISTLEDSINVSLFHRHARGLILTEEGELLHKTAKEIFGKLAMIEGQIADSKNVSEGPLRITVAGFIGATWLAPLLGDFRKKHPDIQLSLLMDNRIFNLSMREADAAIRLYKPEQPDLVQHHLGTIPFSICASKKYLKEHGVPKKANQLKNHTLLGYPDDATAPFTNPNWLLQKAQIDSGSQSNVLMLNSLFAISEAVKGGAGIAALPNYMIDSCDKLEVILNDVSHPGIEMYFVYPEERQHSQRIDIFYNFLTFAAKASAF